MIKENTELDELQRRLHDAHESSANLRATIDRMEAELAEAKRRYGRFYHAITDALGDMNKHPDDSVQGIWNKALEGWNTGFCMNHNYKIEEDKLV